MSKLILTSLIQAEITRQTEVLISGFGDRMDVSKLWDSFDDAQFKRLRRVHMLAVDRLCRALLKQESPAEREKMCSEAKTVHLVFVFDRIKAAIHLSKKMTEFSPFGVKVPASVELDQFVTNTMILHRKGDRHGA